MTREELIEKTSLVDVVNVEVMINMRSWMRGQLYSIKSSIIKELDKSWNAIVHATSSLNNDKFDETIKNLHLYQSTLTSDEFDAFLDDCHN